MTVFAGGLRTNQVESHKGSLRNTREAVQANQGNATLRMRLFAPGNSNRSLRCSMPVCVVKQRALGNTTECEFYQQHSVGGNQIARRRVLTSLCQSSCEC